MLLRTVDPLEPGKNIPGGGTAASLGARLDMFRRDLWKALLLRNVSRGLIHAGLQSKSLIQLQAIATEQLRGTELRILLGKVRLPHLEDVGDAILDALGDHVPDLLFMSPVLFEVLVVRDRDVR